MNKIQIIGFDADDTLWENGLYFRRAEQQFAALLANYIDPESLHSKLYKIEMKNMPCYGYGAMAYTLSLIETAIEVSQAKLNAETTSRILDLGREILSHPVELLRDVETILPRLQQGYRLIIVTKGDILDQERKLNKSGLLSYFHHIEIVSEKNDDNYKDLLHRLDVKPEAFLMVGNSLKFDILPVLRIGGQAVHIPSEGIWEHEHCAKPLQAYYEISRLGELLTLLS